jgi:hypothetical protein
MAEATEHAIPVGGRRSIELPDDLQEAVAEQLASVSPAQWTREAQALSARYRAPRAAGAEPLATGAPRHSATSR